MRFEVGSGVARRAAFVVRLKACRGPISTSAPTCRLSSTGWKGSSSMSKSGCWSVRRMVRCTTPPRGAVSPVRAAARHCGVSQSRSEKGRLSARRLIRPCLQGCQSASIRKIVGRLVMAGRSRRRQAATVSVPIHSFAVDRSQATHRRVRPSQFASKASNMRSLR